MNIYCNHLWKFYTSFYKNNTLVKILECKRCYITKNEEAQDPETVIATIDIEEYQLAQKQKSFQQKE